MRIREEVVRDDNGMQRPDDSCSAHPADGGEAVSVESKENAEYKIQGW